jgi:hypothetical protein
VSHPAVTGRRPVLPARAARAAALAYAAALVVVTLAGAAGNVALFLPSASCCRWRSSAPRSPSPGSAGPTSTMC